MLRLHGIFPLILKCKENIPENVFQRFTQSQSPSAVILFFLRHQSGEAQSPSLFNPEYISVDEADESQVAVWSETLSELLLSLVSAATTAGSPCVCRSSWYFSSTSWKQNGTKMRESVLCIILQHHGCVPNWPLLTV